MAPLPPDSTARVEIDYSVAGYDHTAQIRFAEPSTVTDVIDDFTAFIASVGSLFMPSTFIGARVAASGSNIFNPVAGGWPVGWGTGSPQPFHTAWYLDFIGRSLDGRRVRFALFGANVLAEGGDYRITTAENSAVNGGVDDLNSAEGTFLSINGFQPVWYPYANSGVNAYWRNKVR